MTIFSTDSNGVAFSNDENKAFDYLSYPCAGTILIAEGKVSVHVYCKYLHPDADIMVEESTIEGTEAQWKFLLGTGKWKGITGGGTHKEVTRGKPVVAGTSQECRGATGTYSLPQTQQIKLIWVVDHCRLRYAGSKMVLPF